MKRSPLLALAFLAFLPGALRAEAPGPRRIVLMVCDGLRPDFITDANMPTLARLGREGVFFTRHHAVYPSSTEVNGAALATGVQPARSTIIANREFRAGINPRLVLATEAVKTVRRGDLVSGGKYLAAPTLAELLQGAGEPTAVAGTKGVALFMDRRLARDTDAAAKSRILFAGDALPAGVFGALTAALGEYRGDARFPNVYADRWTTRALTAEFWKDGVPRFSVLWLSDPDFTQHHKGVGSPDALRALRSADDNLALVLATLDARGQRDNTDIFVASDHGFSTISRRLNVTKLLTAAGFPVVRKNRTVPTPGDILVDGLGGSVFFYVAGHDPAMTARLVTFLQSSDFAGVVFTRDGAPGTFAMSAAGFDSPAAPDVAVTMRWTDEPNAFGAPGSVVSEGDRPVGLGTHASLSRWDMHNTLVAAGPDLRRGFADPLPTSNVDVAPTLAHLLGLTPPMDGRILREALAGAAEPGEATREELSAETETPAGPWRQTLKVSRYDGRTYLDEGNRAVP